MPEFSHGGGLKGTDFNELTRELILRQQFLVLALDRADDSADTVSRKDCRTLVSDLNESIDYFRSIADGLILPAFAHITNKRVGDWEKELFVAFSAETPRWDRVHRLNHELDQVLELLGKLGESRPGYHDEIEKWHVMFQAHKNLQASVLRNWIVAEQTKGNPIEKMIEYSESEWRKEWERVLASLGVGNVDTDESVAPNTFHSVVDKILHPFSHKATKRVA